MVACDGNRLDSIIYESFFSFFLRKLILSSQRVTSYPCRGEDNVLVLRVSPYPGTPNLT